MELSIIYVILFTGSWYTTKSYSHLPNTESLWISRNFALCAILQFMVAYCSNKHHAITCNYIGNLLACIISYVRVLLQSYLYHGQLIAVLISGLVVAISFQYPVSRSLKIQAVAISRLELLLHSRHPPILDQLTGDPNEDEPFWDNLEKNREKEAPPTAATPAVLLKGGKPIGGFTPCQDTITDSYAEVKYPVVSLEKVSNGVAKQENIYTEIHDGANKTTGAVNHAYVTDDVTAL